jgi:hypothetical protein
MPYCFHSGRAELFIPSIAGDVARAHLALVTQRRDLREPLTGRLSPPIRA